MFPTFLNKQLNPLRYYGSFFPWLANKHSGCGQIDSMYHDSLLRNGSSMVPFLKCQAACIRLVDFSSIFLPFWIVFLNKALTSLLYVLHPIFTRFAVCYTGVTANITHMLDLMYHVLLNKGLWCGHINLNCYNSLFLMEFNVKICYCRHTKMLHTLSLILKGPNNYCNCNNTNTQWTSYYGCFCVKHPFVCEPPHL